MPDFVKENYRAICEHVRNSTPNLVARRFNKLFSLMALRPANQYESMNVAQGLGKTENANDGTINEWWFVRNMERPYPEPVDTAHNTHLI
jgi:hypothetical protein